MDYKTHLEQCRIRREKIRLMLEAGKTQGQVAQKMRVSRQRIQQIAKAMREQVCPA